MNSLKKIKNKIIADKSSLKSTLEAWAKDKKRIVFTNGCFDILHRGHIDYLAKAADYGDVLVVGLNTDDSVSRLKGPHRPIQDEKGRADIMAALEFVDLVVYFNEDTPYDLIKTIQPDVLVKGADYKAEDIVGYDIVKAKGGKVETLEFLPGYSTSAVEAKIKNA
ncbi:MAG: D-glycero-beta-D-manno-heptose 1-phosphate adenylyltransferase [Bacteroidales bacterium]|nr:D-glycero-beta-D-manno-heptose 1-phosphate adenylyltransferase [Bacteroidales bacterium]